MTRSPHRPAVESQWRRRWKPTLGVYGVLAIFMLIGAYFSIAYEETAIAPIPPAEDVTVFAPLTPALIPTLPPPPPTRTPSPLTTEDLPATWQEGIADLQDQKCIAYHNSATASGGLDLGSYQGLYDGGDSGPATVPGESHTSGGHLGQFSPEELDQVVHWIELGAPES